MMKTPCFEKKLSKQLLYHLIIVISVEVYLEFITLNHNKNCRDAFDGKKQLAIEKKKDAKSH